jgi:signal transduction histidine kinase
MRRWPDLALGVAGVGVVASLVMVAVNWPHGDTVFVVGQVAELLVACVVRWRRPDLAVSAWVAMTVLASVLSGLADSTLLAVLDQGVPAAVIATLTAVGLLATGFGFATTLELLACYPDEQVAIGWERRVRAAAWAVPGVVTVVMLATPLVPVPSYFDAADVDNPMHLLPVSVSPAAAEVINGLSFLVVLGGFAVLIVHYRRASHAVRRRIRWLLVPFPLVGFVGFLNVVLGDMVVIWILFLLLQPAIPIAAAVGILQPRGWDADWVLRRSLVYGILWTAIVGILVGTAAVAGTAAGRYVPVGWAVLIALAVSLIFQPLRRWLESLAERWVFGERVDHSGVITRLGATLADTFELENLLPRMVSALEQGLQLEWARVQLDGMDDAPSPGAPDVVVPIELHGAQLGIVECGPKRDGPWTDEDRTVAVTFARQAALAVRNVRLTEQMARYAADLEVSRSRIARSAEAERRRIERNIHDGIQQDLVVLIGMAGHIQTEHDPAAITEEMADLRQRLERVLGDLRDLASGIYPSVLSDQGVLPAVEALVASDPRPIRFRADATLRTLRLPEEIEAAAYFTVAEALTNSLKHAAASRVDITLSRVNGSLLIEVEDDGAGFDLALAPSGRGLQGLADRVGALGGQLGVDSEPGRGTVVQATLSTTNTGGI